MREPPPASGLHNRGKPSSADPLVERRIRDNFQQIGDEAESCCFGLVGGRDKDFGRRSAVEVGRELVGRRGEKEIFVGGVEDCDVFLSRVLERFGDLPFGTRFVSRCLGGGDGGLAGAAELGLVDLVLFLFWSFFRERKRSGLRKEEEVDEQRASRRRPPEMAPFVSFSLLSCLFSSIYLLLVLELGVLLLAHELVGDRRRAHAQGGGVGAERRSGCICGGGVVGGQRRALSSSSCCCRPSCC